MKIINLGFIFVIFIFSLNSAANEINVEKCIKLINDLERLTCYDNLFRANEKAVVSLDREPRQENTLDKVITNQQNNIDQNKANLTEKVDKNVEDFGLIKKIFSKPEQEESITAQIKSLKILSNQRAVIYLDNGQVWSSTESLGRFKLKANQEIIISKRSTLGSYFVLKVQGKTGFVRVKRVK
tara:strand:- start:1749 stop:2297 length:549 start_codon:yes stop_codon:yes gene_type:complete